MATSEEYLTFVCDQIARFGAVRYRKMFGDATVYLDDKPIILIIFMEVKKSPKADLEGRKSTWLLVGYVVVLAFMFVAFEWTQRDVKIDTSQAVADVVYPK